MAHEARFRVRSHGPAARLLVSALLAAVAGACSNSNPSVVIIESDAQTPADEPAQRDAAQPPSGSDVDAGVSADAATADAGDAGTAIDDAGGEDASLEPGDLPDADLGDGGMNDPGELDAGDGEDTADTEAFVVFRDPETGFETSEVHDVDREVVRFDAEAMAMVWSDDTPVGGWMTDGVDLDWTRSGVAFQVAFGRERGEQRAYFTETLTGTICDLNITGPDQLSIFATSELPPQE